MNAFIISRSRKTWTAAGVLVGYTAAIGLAQWLLVFVGTLAGAIAYALVLLGLVNHASLGIQDRDDASRWQTTQSNLLLALALVPLLHLIAVSVPTRGLTAIQQQLLVAGPLIPALAWVYWVARVPSLSLRSTLPWVQVGIAAVGVPLGYAAFLVSGAKSIEIQHSATNLFAAAFVVTVAAIVEEMTFRGFVQRTAAAVFPRSAFIVSGALFGISYLGTRPFTYVGCMVAAGFLFSLLAQATRSLAGVTAAHAFLNIGLLVVWPTVLK
jgi:membrane protease YdiL (CAAX protease family)